MIDRQGLTNGAVVLVAVWAVLLGGFGCGTVCPSRAELPADDAPTSRPTFALSEPLEYFVLQRDAGTNVWDDGKAIDAEVGRQLFAIASQARQVKHSDLPMKSIGVMGPHYGPPGYVIAVKRISSDGTEESVTFSFGLEYLAPSGSYHHFRLTEDQQAAVAELLLPLRDQGKTTIAQK